MAKGYFRNNFVGRDDSEQQELASGGLNNPALDDKTFLENYNAAVNTPQQNNTINSALVEAKRRAPSELTNSAPNSKYTITRNGIPYHYADERTYKAALANMSTSSNNSSITHPQQSVRTQNNSRSRSKGRGRVQDSSQRRSYDTPLKTASEETADHYIEPAQNKKPEPAQNKKSDYPDATMPAIAAAASKELSQKPQSSSKEIRLSSYEDYANPDIISRISNAEEGTKIITPTGEILGRRKALRRVRDYNSNRNRLSEEKRDPILGMLKATKFNRNENAALKGLAKIKFEKGLPSIY